MDETGTPPTESKKDIDDVDACHFEINAETIDRAIALY
jgi:hypothetical protein